MTARLQPTAVSVEDAARILTASGGRPVTREMIEADVQDGAPVNPDGTVNLIQYTAWLVKEMATRGN